MSEQENKQQQSKSSGLRWGPDFSNIKSPDKLAELPPGMEDEWHDPEDFDEHGNKKWKRKKNPTKHNIGIYPHRCDDRLEDFIQGLVKSPLRSGEALRTYIRCMRSEVGEEPTEPYLFMDDDTREYYEEMAAKGRIRTHFLHPTSHNNTTAKNNNNNNNNQ